MLEPQEFLLANLFDKYERKVDIILSSSAIGGVKLGDICDIPKEFPISSAMPSGDYELRECIGNKYNTRAENVFISNGASEFYFLLCASILNRGDLVVTEKPVYPTLRDVPIMLGSTVIDVERKFEEDYKININDLEDAIRKKPKLLVLTNAHNPSGVEMNEKILEEITYLCEKYEVIFVCDEIYKDFHPKIPYVYNISDNNISFSSISKVFGCGGIRLGWGIVSQKLFKRMMKIRNHLSIGPSSIAEFIAKKIFEKEEELIRKAKKIVETNRALIDGWITARDDVECVMPDAGPVCFPKFLKHDVDDLHKILLNKYSTLTITGKCFYGGNHIRIGLGTDTKMLVEGMKRLSLAMASIS